MACPGAAFTKRGPPSLDTDLFCFAVAHGRSWVRSFPLPNKGSNFVPFEVTRCLGIPLEDDKRSLPCRQFGTPKIVGAGVHTTPKAPRPTVAPTALMGEAPHWIPIASTVGS